MAPSDRHEGLALLTTIAEDTGFCNQSALEKRLVSKMLHLREALDLPCRSSCDALDQILLDTLEALKIAYPNCLSGLSGNHTSSVVQQGLIHLCKVLVSVQDCHAEEHSQSSNLGFEKQTIIETESLDRVGERVAVVLDQVIPAAKEFFSFMEISRSANAISAAWPEDLPERRSLPPVLCRTRSLSHCRNAGHHPSDSAMVSTPCRDGATRHAEQLKVQEPVPWQEADQGGCAMEDGDGQTSRRDPPSTPTGDSCALLQLTLSSVSPHPLSPSPVPLLGMPMLLRSWEEEAVQDDNAAVVSSPTDAQPAEEAAPTAQQGAVDVGDSAISVPNEAGQPSSSSAVDGSAAVPSLLLALTAHSDRVQEGASSAGKSVEAVASASPPPPPPSVEQGAPPPANVSRAPPPPPPGNIAAALRARRAAGKLKRSAQMGTLYRHLRDRVEGSCAHGGKAQARKKPRTPGGPKGGDTSQGMADALAEMTKRTWARWRGSLSTWSGSWCA